MSERQQQILIVEDDQDVAHMLSAYFSVQGYRATSVEWGEDAVRLCLDKVPDLVLLDIRLPGIDGYEVARQLRSHRRTQGIPIIFLTDRRERRDKLTGLEMGVVDYITKPFDIHELRLRVRNVLRRAASHPSPDNPVTGLPEGPLVDERLAELVGPRKKWGLLAVTLRGLGHFRDLYGFIASDDVLRSVSLMIGSELPEADGQSRPDFLGHLSRDTFVVVTGRDNVKDLAARLKASLEPSLAQFYPLKDRAAEQEGPQRLALATSSLVSGTEPFESVEDIRQAIQSVTAKP